MRIGCPIPSQSYVVKGTFRSGAAGPPEIARAPAAELGFVSLLAVSRSGPIARRTAPTYSAGPAKLPVQQRRRRETIAAFEEDCHGSGGLDARGLLPGRRICSGERAPKQPCAGCPTDGGFVRC